MVTPSRTRALVVALTAALALAASQSPEPLASSGSLADLITFVSAYLLSQWIPLEHGQYDLILLALRIVVIFVMFLAIVWSLGLSAEDRMVLGRFRQRAFGFFSRK